ncbi:MAG: type IV pilus assembly protein PilM [Chthoniobacterales bacterium]
MQTVSLAEFQTSPDGSLTLLQFHSTELMADPGADATRPGQLKVAVEQLRQTAKLKSTNVCYSLPSQAVFARYLSLPGSTPEELDQIIGFEAQQNIPFPIDEVVWDYQALGEARDGKLNVALLAIKTDTLEELNQAVVDAGFSPQVIDVAPMALYNAFRYNYGDQPGCSMLIDIGARTTNLIFIDGNKAYSRSIPIGGNSISVAIAKELDELVESAESLKKQKGLVSLGGSYADPEDPVSGRIAKLSRTTMTRLHAEIARSISFYRANQGGSQPMRAYLAGGTVAMPYMLEFFAEKMQMPVEFFNPFRNVALASSVDQSALSTTAPALGESVGLAARQIGDSPVEINLRPPSVVREHDLNHRKPFLIAAALCLFLIPLAGIVYFTKAAAVRSEVLSDITAEVNSLQNFADAFDKTAAEKDRMEAMAVPLLTAAAERQAWIAVINDLGQRLPADFIWVTQITPLSAGTPVTVGKAAEGARAGTSASAAPTRPTPPGQDKDAQEPAIDALRIDGLYLDNSSQTKVIDDFVNNLTDSSVFEVNPGDSTTLVTKRSQPDNKTWAYSYQVVLPLKNPISLP